MTPQDTMRLALEALETHVPHYLKDRGYAPIEALKAALAQQEEPVVHHGFSKTNQHLRAINESLDKQLDEVMRERDHREEIINQLCDAVLGPDRYEWSSMYFFGDAVREVEERMAALAQQGERQPLTTQQRDDLWNALSVQDTNQDYYIRGILDAERHHGITGAAPAAQPCKVCEEVHAILDTDESMIIRDAKDGYPEGRASRTLTLQERVKALCVYAADWKRWYEETQAAPAPQAQQEPDTWTDDGGWTFPVERQIIQTR